MFGDERHFLQNRPKEYSKIVNTFLFFSAYVSRCYNLYENKHNDPSHYDFEVTASRYIKKRMSGSREYTYLHTSVVCEAV